MEHLNSESLTPRQREVLALMACGMTDADIASALFIETGSVKKLTHAIYQRLGLIGRGGNNRVLAVLYAMRAGVTQTARRMDTDMDN